MYTCFDDEGLYEYDAQGEFLWKYDPGKIVTIGMGPRPSPVPAGELLILQCDSSDQKSKLVALDRRDGNLVWKTDRTTDVTWTTPVLVAAEGKSELSTTANEVVISYDPKAGKERWR